jgi:hypothetical protein
MEAMLGAFPSYVNNYTRGKARILMAIRQQAMEGLDLASMDQAKVQAFVVRCKEILRQNLPKTSDRKKVKEFDALLAKMGWIPRADAPPKFDGDLSDPVWEKAAVLDGFTERDTLLDSKHKTEGRIMRVGDSLVVGFTCYQVGDIWAETKPEVQTGTRIWRESSVEFFFGRVAQPGEKVAYGQNYAQYIVNSLGAFRGFGQAADNREGVEAAVKLDPQMGAFSIEAAFPLKTKAYDLTAERVLTFNIMRNVFTRNSFAADVMIGWYPIFYTAGEYHSRGFIFLE